MHWTDTFLLLAAVSQPRSHLSASRRRFRPLATAQLSLPPLLPLATVPQHLAVTFPSPQLSMSCHHHLNSTVTSLPITTIFQPLSAAFSPLAATARPPNAAF